MNEFLNGIVATTGIFLYVYVAVLVIAAVVTLIAQRRAR